MLHVFPGNLKTLKDCFLPEVFLNYCHQNREPYRRKAEGASGAAPSIVEKHLEKLFVKQTNSHPHFFYSPPFSVYASQLTKLLLQLFLLSPRIIISFYCHCY